MKPIQFQFLFHKKADLKRGEKLKRVSEDRGKSVIQMFRDWIDGIKEDK